MPLLLSKNRIKYKRFIKILNIINYKKSDKRRAITHNNNNIKKIIIIMENFIKARLNELAESLKARRDEFVNDFMADSADSRFTAENANKIINFLTNPENHHVGSTELVPGLRVNIDWTSPKTVEQVFPEVHRRFHDIHIPTFTEGIFISSASETLEVHQEFDTTRDIGFYVRPEDSRASKVNKNKWMFIPAGVYHGPLYGGFETSKENYFLQDGQYKVVKICIKILAD